MNSVIRIPTHPQSQKPHPSYTAYDARPSISPILVEPCWRYESPNTKSRPMPKPLPMLLALQGAGIHPAEGSWILYQLAEEGDRPYHAALLMNGKACVVSQNDQVFYGPPGKLKREKVLESWRTRCLNEQTRYLKTDTGLEINIKVQNGSKTVTFNRQIRGPIRFPLFPKAVASLHGFAGRPIEA